jgi:hypothetical protein
MTFIWKPVNLSSKTWTQYFVLITADREEWEHDNETFGRYYMESGDIRIEKRIHHAGSFSMPTKHYHGITIGIQQELAEESLKREMPGIKVDIGADHGKVLCYGLRIRNFFLEKSTILKSDEPLDKIFNELYSIPKDIRIAFFKVKTSK